MFKGDWSFQSEDFLLNIKDIQIKMVIFEVQEVFSEVRGPPAATNSI